MRMLVVAAMLVSGAAVAGSPPGAASCSGCHAFSGKPSAFPSIFAREANDTLATMIAFRDGTRPATVMNRIAKGFSDDELRAIAAWLATQKP
jgi:sulfide dehydrogenase cytochrome subunit